MKSLYHKFTTHLKKTLRDAFLEAQTRDDAEVLPEHLLRALVHQRGSIGAEVLWKSGYKNGVKNGDAMTETLSPEPDPRRSLPPLSQACQNVLVKAALAASHYTHHYIGTEHLLWGILELDSLDVKNFFTSHRLKPADVKQHLTVALKSTSKFPEITRMFSKNPEGGTDAATQDQPSALEFFATDLTNKDTQKKIDPVIGREQEIERVIHILSRRTKNNPLLVGDPGVGKTAIIEGLAKKITLGSVPPVLQHKRILNLDLSLVVAGTMYRGEFEHRIKQIIEEVQQNKDIILFIDEVHTLIGAGSTSGSMDAANILKPALAKGDVAVIGATTFEEYHKHIESDPALERRFQPVMIDELNPTDAVEVLRGVKENYERFHRVTIADDAIVSAVQLSARYIADRNLPDKAIDLLDEACSKLKVNEAADPLEKTIRHFKKELTALREAKDHAIFNERFQDAMKIKARERVLSTKLDELVRQYDSRAQHPIGEITAKDIAAVVSRITKIPLHELTVSDKDRLMRLDEELSQQIVGQDETVSSVASFIKRSRAGLTDEARPQASFMFLGPSGVGKTELAKVIARTVFEDEKALVRIDMSEFSESFQASKLIGAPAGYVGYKDGGKLTESVKRKPYAVVLFDEIEKAHPEIFNLLLQILEDGALTDATGKKINFRNTIIIMTSNVGIEQLQTGASIGFQAETTEEEEKAKQTYQEMKSRILENLKDTFRPEFLNRIDQIFVFEPLSKEAVQKIVEIQFGRLAEKMKARNITLTWQPSAISYIAKKGFSPEHGAREIRRVLQTDVENLLADEILLGRIPSGAQVTVKAIRDKIRIV